MSDEKCTYCDLHASICVELIDGGFIFVCDYHYDQEYADTNIHKAHE